MPQPLPFGGTGNQELEGQYKGMQGCIPRRPRTLGQGDSVIA